MNKDLMSRSLKKSALFLMLQAAVTMCFAETIPNAGQLLQQQMQPQMKEPESKPLPVPVQPNGTIQGSQTIFVKQFNISGNTQFTESILKKEIADLEGKTQNLAGLQQAADRISDYYASHGYSFSYAFLPVQNLNNGEVQIQIIETAVNGVKVSNQTNTLPWLIRQIETPLQSRQILRDSSLDTLSVRFNQLHGVKSEAALTPGSALGETELSLLLTPAQKIQAYAGADNAGSKYTGEARASAGVRINSIAGLGDQLSLDVLSSGKGVNYGKAGYSAFINGYGTQLGASYSYLKYELREELKNLGYEGSAEEASLWLQQSMRSQTAFGLALSRKQIEDDIRSAQYENHRRVDALQLNLNHSSTDSLFGAGINTLYTALNFGKLDLQSADTKAIDALTRKTDGNFLSAQMNASRLQKLGSSSQLYLSAAGFYSPDNLDSSEAFYVGGPSFMRGYKNSAISGSEGLTASIELRQDLWSSASNKLNGKLFFDAAKLKLNASVWDSLTEKNTISLRSAGAGIAWSNDLLGTLQADAGFALGDKPVQISQRDDHQIWLSWQKVF